MGLVNSLGGRDGLATRVGAPERGVGQHPGGQESVPHRDRVFSGQQLRRIAASGRLSDEAGISGPLAWDRSIQQQFVGSLACASCHVNEYNDWLNSPHADAMNTLRKVHRENVPTCVRCHVVGYGEPTGYRMSARKRQLEGVGCEVCHGAGSAHVLAPRQEHLRWRPPAPVCRSCHDDDHAPAFASSMDAHYDRVDHGAR